MLERSVLGTQLAISATILTIIMTVIEAIVNATIVTIILVDIIINLQCRDKSCFKNAAKCHACIVSPPSPL